MRLIDADALKEDHGMADDCPLCKQKVISCQYDIIYTKMDFCGWIDDAPTIESERKTGYWILADVYGGRKRYRCSECLAFALKTDDGQENLSDYCPVCGARMGEGGQE